MQGQVCDTKDEAYYDALIDRLIVVNPLLGRLQDHPCNQFKAVTGSMTLDVKPAMVIQSEQPTVEPATSRATRALKAAPMEKKRLPLKKE